MTLSRVFRAAAALTLAAGLATPSAAADRADKRELISQAKAAYYSLRQKGLDTFQVNVAVNWDVVLGRGVALAQRENAMKLLNGLHFGMAFDGEYTIKKK